MKVIRPIPTLCHNIISSNVVLDHPEWDEATTYSKGETVVDDACGATVYESLGNGNQGNNPKTTPLEWLAIGVSNYWAMFDDKNDTQTVRNETIEVEIAFNSVVDSIALMNIQATEVRFEAWRGIDDEKVLDETIQLSENQVFDWATYFFSGFEELKNYVSFKMPVIRNGRGKMTLSGGVVKIGSLIYGRTFVIGETVFPITTGIKDFSRKERDVFGNFTIVERAYSNEMQANIIIENGRVDYVNNFLAEFRSKPLVWAAADESFGSTHVIFGFYKDGRITRNHPAYAELPLEIEGVTA